MQMHAKYIPNFYFSLQIKFKCKYLCPCSMFFLEMSIEGGIVLCERHYDICKINNIFATYINIFHLYSLYCNKLFLYALLLLMSLPQLQ